MLFNAENKIDKKYYADYLLDKYGKLGLTRQETANELGISLSFLDKLLREGVGLPSYTSAPSASRVASSAMSWPWVTNSG